MYPIAQGFAQGNHTGQHAYLVASLLPEISAHPAIRTLRPPRFDVARPSEIPETRQKKRRALAAALPEVGCGCFVPDLTRFTIPRCAGARLRALYSNPGFAQKKRCHNASSSQSASTFFCTISSMTMRFPQTREVSSFHLFVASIPILPPSPLTGDAKSR